MVWYALLSNPLPIHSPHRGGLLDSLPSHYRSCSSPYKASTPIAPAATNPSTPLAFPVGCAAPVNVLCGAENVAAGYVALGTVSSLTLESVAYTMLVGKLLV
jgi:hypothetical protein